ncbi:hypothetical protein ACFY8X_12205 [Streptomyces tanashiensis]|uniref:hypothetical protein n=1 Tax=Streptomyces tanashiensis TaxID=67367 RepID=UPI0036E74E8C
MPVTLPPVTFDADSGLAVLRTPNSLYALRLASDGGPRHLYWGPPLDTGTLAEVPDVVSPAASSFEADAADDGLAPQSGARLGPAGLRVRFADELDQVHSGAVLVRHGIGPRLPAGDHASSPIRLRRVGP